MHLFTRALATSVSVGLLTASSCSAPYAAARSDAASDTVGVGARLAQLEADARALTKADGCNTSSQCRTAPVGARACGGPRTYLVYCGASTDSVALYRKLDSLRALEIRYNTTSGMVGTCDIRTPPTVTVQGGRCRESTP